jgi:hypothetical protein
MHELNYVVVKSPNNKELLFLVPKSLPQEAVFAALATLQTRFTQGNEWSPVSGGRVTAEGTCLSLEGSRFSSRGTQDAALLPDSADSFKYVCFTDGTEYLLVGLNHLVSHSALARAFNGLLVTLGDWRPCSAGFLNWREGSCSGSSFTMMIKSNPIRDSAMAKNGMEQRLETNWTKASGAE